ncbi:MAG: hypothetical protein DRO18_07785 [Thermoprotei archaeon]|nr:MAG: hypothetical protein DRO18_07785 [Thermoprotei archaeon]
MGMSVLLALGFSDTLKPGDLLEISVLGQDYSERAVVDRGGTVYLSLVGPVKAAGLTLAEFSDTLSKRLEPFYKDAKVIVKFLNLKEPSVTVTGWVSSPGVIPYKRGMGLLDALQEAGWLLPDADPGGIRLVREGKARKLGLKDEPLAPGDVVVVPKRSACLTWENVMRAVSIVNLAVGVASLYLLLSER